MSYWLIWTGYLIALPILLWWVGNRVVKMSLWLCNVGISKSTPNAQTTSATSPGVKLKAGWFVGGVERILILASILTSNWGIAAGVVALKSVARYNELNTQDNAEYFLVGSLASILWALLVALVFAVYDQTIGFHLLDLLKGSPTSSPNSVLQYIEAKISNIYGV